MRLTDLRRALQRAGDPAKAPLMQAYMKSSMPYHGVPAPLLRHACIEPSLGSREFFLQKAIGWALRQYAWSDGAEIQRYVRANRDRLSPLRGRLGDGLAHFLAG